MRLVHPYVQMMASHQPALTRASQSSQSGLSRDSVTTRTVTTHNKESRVAGHFSFPNLPRVDVAWIDRTRDGAGSLGDRNQTRSARVTFDRDRYSTYGTVNQQRILSGTPGSQTNIQTVLAAVPGAIAFVGLVVPHLVRAGVGVEHRLVLIGSLLLGPVFVVLADIVGRLIAQPGEVQAGIVCAVLGAPVLVAVVRRVKGL